MPVPDYQTFMLPVLSILGECETMHRKGIAVRAADVVGVPAQDRTLMVPSGKVTVLNSRIGWALSYMKQAGLVATTARGIYQITDRGRSVLARDLTNIDNYVLSEFEEFLAFKERSHTVDDSSAEVRSTTDTVSRESPEEALETAYSTLRANLVSQVIDVLKSVSPSRFETIVVDVLQAIGYGRGRVGAARTVGRSGDGGIDGLIEEDRLGLDTVYVQAKRWEGTVGRPVVQAFAGALQGQRAHKGVMITTSDFSADARVYAEKLATRIVLINGQRLAEMMVDNGVGVSDEATYTVKRLDSDYFED